MSKTWQDLYNNSDEARLLEEAQRAIEKQAGYGPLACHLDGQDDYQGNEKEKTKRSQPRDIRWWRQ